MRTRRLHAVLLPALLGCAAAIAGCAGNKPRSTVMPADQAELVTEQCSRPNPPHYDSTWQPSPHDIAQLEQDLPALNALAPPGGDAPHVGDATAYDRQYFGILVHGHHKIYINAFIDAMANKDWKAYAIVVCDGGSAAWGAVYDPSSRDFSDFSFNGKPPG